MSFLKKTPPHRYQTTKSLEANIRDVGYKAEDILESYIGKQSRSFYRTFKDAEIDGDHDENVAMLSLSLMEVIKGFESLIAEIEEIQSSTGVQVEQMNSLSVAGSSRPASLGKSKFVLLDVKFMNQIKEQLFFETTGLKVIPIVGMGGIGKTTLAKALIEDPLTLDHFDIRGWVTVSQQYSIEDVVQNLLNNIRINSRKKIDTGVVDLNAENDVPKNVQLHKTLYGRRYLVVLDDLWDIEACDKLRSLLPDWNNGSRIMVTTRQSGVATFAAKSYHEMKLLNGDTSWDLLRQVVFPQDVSNCPPELVRIGKEIAKKCSGLPLTISVIGGLLLKGKMTQENWEHVAENMKSALTEEGDQCLEILSLSYNYLPHHLKSCFLYFGIYPEDYTIIVSSLLRFWVVEGFLKPGQTDMENDARENLEELIKRNLILVEKVKYNGKPELCKIHDLLRDLCIREARKEKLFHVWNEHTDFNREETKGYRRLSILPSSNPKGVFDMLKSMPGIRSYMCFVDDHDIIESKFKFGFQFLRVVKPYYPLKIDLNALPNLRWIQVPSISTEIATSMFSLWDLQYLFISYYEEDQLPLCIWFMPQLRHLRSYSVNVGLPPPPPQTEMICVLKRLEVLSGVINFRCEDEVLKRIPNLRKLKITYTIEAQMIMDWSYYHLNNLIKMSKLETVSFNFHGVSKDILVGHISFPISLKNLVLSDTKISWKHMDQIIGVLPNLEILKLHQRAFVGPTWETSEDHFKKLEYLMIYSTRLIKWTVEDSNHFPSLRHLYLQDCECLEEIPTCIGQISTLDSIELKRYCSHGVVSSAKVIQDECDYDIKLVINDTSRYAYEDEDEEE